MTEAECRLRETAERATPGVWVYREPKDATSQNPYDREGLLVDPRGLPIPDPCPDNVKVVLTELDRLREACTIFEANSEGAASLFEKNLRLSRRVADLEAALKEKS